MISTTYTSTSVDEAIMMDPQQRHLLEVTKEALDDAGITPENLPKNTGVFVGISMMDHPFTMIDDPKLSNMYQNTGSAHSVAANRISYTFNLQGPSIAVDTACTSSMSALHHAVTALWNGECEAAIVAGANILLAPEVTIAFSALGVLSPDGKSCPFDASASGYVRSEGYGVVIIRPLDKAIENNDHIYCTVRASASGHNGRSLSITMPSAPAQEQLMRNVYSTFGIPVESVDYIEAHGTGTPVGDPIEVEAISKTFAQKKSPVPIGSSKSNFGHMECAAGIVQVIKVALMLKNRKLYPSINFTKLNPKLDPNEINVAVQTALQHFCEDKTFRIGINSFGFGGALVHMVFDEYTNKSVIGQSSANWQIGVTDSTEDLTGEKIIVPLSAKTETGLKDTANEWLNMDCSEEDAKSVVAWAASRRPHYNNRVAILADSGTDLRNKIRAFLNNEASDEIIRGKAVNHLDNTKLCFVFPGQGQQHFHMGRSLYNSEYAYREAIDSCDKLFASLSGYSFIERTGMFKQIGDSVVDENVIKDVEVSQPAILFNQIGLLRLLISCNIKPDAVVGHSLGEVASAYGAGKISLDEAVKIIYHRSIEQKKLSGTGSMAAMRCSVEEGEALCRQYADLFIACYNAPESITVAGSEETIKEVCEQYPGKAKQLRVDCAFHTPHMDPLKKSFTEAISGQLENVENSSLPFYSTVTGDLMIEQADVNYWWMNIRESVKFESAVAAVCRDNPDVIFLELGAAVTLVSSTRQTAKAMGISPVGVIPCGQRNKDDRISFLGMISTLYTLGIEISWEQVMGTSGSWTQLPTYAWQHQYLFTEAEEYKKRRLGLEDKTYLGQNGVLDLDVFPFLRDHVVEDHIVFPGAGYIEYVVQAETQTNESIQIEDISFNKILTLTEETSAKLSVQKKGNLCTLTSGSLEHASMKVRALGGIKSAQEIDIQAILSVCTEMVTGTDLYNRFTNIGLCYGPAFQTVKEVFIGDGKSLGFLHPATDTKQKLHTAQLDGAFQVLLSPLLQGTNLYLPHKIKSLKMMCACVPTSETLIVYGKLEQVEDNSITGNISISDTKGKLFVIVDGFEAVKIGKLDGLVDISNCVYTTSWQPMNAVLPDIGIWHEEFSKAVLTQRFPREMSAIVKFEQYAPCLKQISAAYAKTALELVPEGNRHPTYERYVARLEELVRETEISINIKEIPNLLDIMSKNVPEFAFEVQMFRRMGEALPNTLVDPKPTIQMLFGFDCVPQYFLEALSVVFYYKSLTSVIQKAVKYSLKHKKLVRILEVGSRMGGMTKHIIEGIHDEVQSGSVEVFFTDLNTTFFAHGRQYLEGCPDIKYEQLDIENDIREQGFIPNTFDIVLCLDTLHSVQDISIGLQNMKNLLVRDGWLVVLEPTNALCMPEIIFGALALCWCYSDHRKSSCWMDKQGWLKAFEDGGLMDVTSVSSPNEFSHSIIVGRNIHTAPPLSVVEPYVPNFTVVSDDTRSTTHSLLVSELEKRTCCKSLSVKDLHLNSLANGSDVIYLCTNDDFTNTTDLLHLLQTCENCIHKHNVWVLLQNSTGSSLPKGLCRVAANELSNCNIYSLSVDMASAEIDGIVAAVCQPVTHEHELQIKNGQICIPRIMKSALPETKQKRFSAWQLLSSGGDNNTVFHAKREQTTGMHEVKIQVHSAGVNFKDILQSMNMLQGYASHCMGLECSGTIVEVGKNVTEFSVGDPVIAFGEDLFASHVFCNVDHVVKKPHQLTLVEAAGSGIVYSTAYHALVDRGGLHEGECVLIHSACGGVGQAAIQVARLVGAKIICTAGTPEKREYLKKVCGVQYVSDSRSGIFFDDVMKWTGSKGVDIVLNSLSGKLLELSVKCLGHGGRFCEIGKRDILSNSSLELGPLLENKAFLSIHMDILMKHNSTKYKKIIKRVASLLEEKSIFPLMSSVYPIANVMDAFQHMKSGKHIGKVVLDIPQNFTPHQILPPRELFSAQATYIITGGLGGIGLALARWMASKGAKHIALVSRSGVQNFYQRATLKSLTSKGVRVYIVQADVANESGVQAVLKDLQQAPPVKGIFHLAAVIEDAPVTALSEKSLKQTIESKALSAYYLHKTSVEEGLDLDHFMLFSSATVLWGNPDQAAYCAANSYLDSLAEERQSLGLPALSIQLGAVQGAGFLENKPTVTRIIQSKGFLPIHINDYLKVIENLLFSDDAPPVISITNQDWEASQPFCYKDCMKFRHLVANIQQTTRNESMNPEVLTASVIAKLGDLVGVPVEDIDVTQPMIHYGVDSMSAVEIVNWLNKQHNLNVSQLDILGGMTTAILLENALEGNVVMPLRQ